MSSYVLRLASTVALAGATTAWALPAHAQPAAQPPDAQPPAAQPPDAQPPAAQPPDAQPPDAQPPAAQPPAEEEQPPAAAPPAAQPPAAQPPAAQPPAAQPPAAQPPAAQPPAAQPPAAPPAPTPAPEPELSPEPPATAPQPPQQPISADDERPLPDYDGRGDDPVTAGDVFIWIPRGIFFPVWLVSEYVIRAPIGALVTAIEEHDVPGVLKDVFTFGPDGKSGVVPSGLIDFGFHPSIGVYFFNDDLITEGNQLRAHFSFGGINWYRVTGTVRQQLGSDKVGAYPMHVQLRGVYSHRPDWQFYGIGPDSDGPELEEQSGFPGGRPFDIGEGEYTAERGDGTLSFLGGFWRSSHFEAYAGLRDVSFRSDDPRCAGLLPGVVCDESPTIEEQAAAGTYELPPMYPRSPLDNNGYTVARVGFDASIDTRRRRNIIPGEASDYVSPAGSGVKVAMRGELASGLNTLSTEAIRADPFLPTKLQYVRYGGTLGGYLDIYNQRVIGAELVADFADPTNDNGIVPFTELATLGGERPMRGYLQYRLLDRSAIAARLEYRWPIWVYLDGVAQYEVGNVFGEHLENFDPHLLRQSFGGGISGIGSRDHAFEVLLAAGTSTFETGSQIDSFRFVFGATSGF